jgi:hypothetical protein
MLPDTSYTYYEVLEVTPEADTSVLRAAYRKAARRAHPDHGGHPLMFRMVQAAWQVLSDPDSRADYDTRLAAGGPPRQGHNHDPSIDLFLVGYPHPHTGLPYGRLEDARSPERLRPGTWVTTQSPWARSTAYVRRNDRTEVHVELPPLPIDARATLGTPSSGPDSVPLLHGTVAADGRLASVPRPKTPTNGTPDLGRRVVVATPQTWIPGTVQDEVTVLGDALMWVVRLWTWDLSG